MTIRRRVSTHAALVLAALLVTGGVAGPVPAQPAGLDGTWTTVSAERDGKPTDELKGHRLTCTKNTFVIESDGKMLYKGTFKTDAAKKPAQFDFRHTDGQAKGKTWRGIYRLDGDTLTTVDNGPDPTKPRPTQFATTPDSGYIMIVFKRVPR